MAILLTVTSKSMLVPSELYALASRCGRNRCNNIKETRRAVFSFDPEQGSKLFLIKRIADDIRENFKSFSVTVEVEGLGGVIDNHQQAKIDAKGNQYGMTAPRADAKWSGSMPIPEIGDRVNITFNGFGLGTVRGYFVEKGESCFYQGIYVEVDSPPAWWLKQEGNPRRRCTMVFGREVVLPPVVS